MKIANFLFCDTNLLGLFCNYIFCASSVTCTKFGWITYLILRNNENKDDLDTSDSFVFSLC